MAQTEFHMLRCASILLPRDSMIRSTRHVLLALSVVCGSVDLQSTAAPAEPLNWDLTYQSALRSHPIDKSEWMATWPTWFSKRALVETMASYSGEKIESSLLIETPDARAGDPGAVWFIKTQTRAQQCLFTIRAMTSCKEIDPVKTVAFIRQVMNYRPIQFTPSSGKSNGMLMNYYGFVSVYVDGRTLQRPIASVEWFENLAKQTKEIDEVARLSRAVTELMRDTSAEEDEAAVKQVLDREKINSRGSGDR